MYQNSIFKITATLLTAFVVTGIGYGIYTFANSDKKENSEMVTKEENRSAKIKDFLSLIAEKGIPTEKRLIKIFTEKKERLSSSNCKGSLVDTDRDGIFDGKFLGEEIKNDTGIEDIVVHYNFCSTLWSSKPSISFIETREKLLESDFVELNQKGEFVPAVLKKYGLDGKFQKGAFRFVPKESVF